MKRIQFACWLFALGWQCSAALPSFADTALRALTTDRPDLTESPFTVNPGHVQFESTIVGYAKSRTDQNGISERAFEFATTNVRLGLTQNSELNFAWQPYGITRQVRRGHRDQRDEGIGSIEIRAKINLYGNDRFEAVGDTALAILPFVTLPTDRDNGISVSEVEGGVILPFAIVLPKNFGLGVNAGLFVVQESDGDRGLDGFFSAALSYEWSERFGTYYEIAATFGTDGPDRDPIILATGFTYSVDANTQFDGGVNFGVTNGADIWSPFIGITRRF